MTDKEKIRLQAIKIIDGLNKSCTPNPNGNIMECTAAAEIEALNLIVDYIDSLPKEPVSEDLEEAFKQSFEKVKEETLCVYDYHAGFVDGAQWQKEKMMRNAKTGVVTSDNYIKFDDGTYIDFATMQLKPAFVLQNKDKVKVIIVKEDGV